MRKEYVKPVMVIHNIETANMIVMSYTDTQGMEHHDDGKVSTGDKDIWEGDF